MSEPTTILSFATSIAEQEAPVPLPKGKYPAVLISASIELGKTTGNKYIAQQFRIDPTEYPHDYTEGDPDGTVLNYMRLGAEDKPSSRYNIRRYCETLGLPVPTIELDVSTWLDTPAVVVIEHETYQGITRAVIKEVLAS